METKQTIFLKKMFKRMLHFDDLFLSSDEKINVYLYIIRKCKNHIANASDGEYKNLKNRSAT